MEKKKITKKEVMDAVKKHQHFLNKDCDDWVLMRADFSNCLIEDIELKKLDMMQVNFAGATLKGCKFKDIDFTSSNFENAIIESVLMDNVCMNMTNFRDARITEGSEFKNLVAYYASFVDCCMEYSDFSSATFDYSDFSGAKLKTVNAPYASFMGCKMKEAVLKNAALNYANFIKGEFYRTCFFVSVLTNALFCKSNLYSAHFAGSTLLGADLSDANIDFANFDKAEMDDCLMRSIYDSVKNGNVPCLGLEEIHLVAYKFAQLIARNSNLDSGERIRLCVSELVDYINTLPVAEKLGKIYK